MTTDIKELVKRLRIIGPTLPNDKGYSTTVPQAVAFAADALEALASENERWEKNHEALQDKFDSMRTCACQYDSSDAVCMAHSPALKAAEAERDRLAKSEEGLLKTLGLERREKHAAQTERDRMKVALEEAVKWMDGCAVSGGYPTWHAKARKALGGDK